MRIRCRVGVPMPVVPVVPVRVRVGRITVALENFRIRRGRGQHVVPLQIQLVVPMIGTDLLLVMVRIPSTETSRSASSSCSRTQAAHSALTHAGSTSAAQTQRILVLFPVPVNGEGREKKEHCSILLPAKQMLRLVMNRRGREREKGERAAANKRKRRNFIIFFVVFVAFYDRPIRRRIVADFQ